jgi:hypothetical protein
LSLRFCIRNIVNVVPHEDVRIEADHGLSKAAASKSADTAARALLSMPKPLSVSSTGELLMRKPARQIATLTTAYVRIGERKNAMM